MTEYKLALSFIQRVRLLTTEAVFRKSLSGFVAQVLAKIFALLAVLLLTRTLSSDDYGVFAYARAWVMVLGPFATLGLSYATYRFLPRYIAVNNSAAANGYVLAALLAALSVSLLIIAIYATLSGAGLRLLPADYMPMVTLMFWAIPAASLVLVLRFVAQNLGQVGLSFLPATLLPILQCVLLGVLILSTGLTLSAAVLIFLVANYVAVMVAAGFVHRAWRRKVGYVRPYFRLGSWLTVSLSLTVSSIAMVVNQQADLIIVGSLLGAAEAGLYSIAMSLSLLISMVCLSVSATFVPEISRAVGAGDWPLVQQIVRRSSPFFSLPAFAGVLLFVVVGQDLLGVFGDYYREAFLVLSILSISELLIAASEPSGHLLNISGRQKENTFILIAGALLNIVLNFILVPLWGIEGAAIATLLSTLMWTTWRIILVKRYFDIVCGIYASFSALAFRRLR